MYCINCGVKLERGEKKCPLCETPVYHPDFKSEPQQKLYPSGKMPRSASSKNLSGAVLILFFIPLFVSLWADLQPNGRIDWFFLVFGGLAVAYISFALPFWFARPNPVIFTPCAFAAALLYIFYINYFTNGNWFFAFALPVAGGLCLICCAFVTLLYYLKKGRLYIFGGAFILLGGLLVMTEFLTVSAFGVAFVGWSMYPLAALSILGALLIYLAINRSARELLEQKLFF